MKRGIAVCILGGSAVAGAASAHAGPLELGGFLGPRLYSDNSRLGQRGITAPVSLTSALALGGRIGLPLWRGQLVPEFELALASTQTDKFAVGVTWLEPRLSLRYQLRTESWLRPFLMVGGGAPISLSGNTDFVAHQILGEGFVGAGVAVWTGNGFGLRVDGRLSFLPGDDPGVAVEGEFGVGVIVPLGRSRRSATVATPVVADADGDGLGDAVDGCPGQREDADGFEDKDGCPDIDNDLDHVLDIADACAAQPETYNAVADDDGCPDVVPPEVSALEGPLPALVYPPGERVAPRSGQLVAALDRIAAVLIANPTVRVRLIGHTDDREAAALAPEGEEPDLAALSAELSLARVTALRELLILRGLEERRVVLESRGAEEPVSENDSAGGRQANRRVELQLLVSSH